MRKKYFLQGMLLATMILLLAACGKKKEYAKLIPRDAAIVVMTQPKALVQSLGGTAAIEKFIVQSDNELLKSLLSSPEEAGVDAAEQAYLFATLNRDEPTLLMKLKKKSALEQWLEKMHQQGMSDKLQRRGDFSWTFFKGQGYCAFTDELVVWVHAPLVAPEIVLTRLSQLLRQDEEESFLSTNSFQQLSELDENIAFYLSLSTLPNAEEISSLLGLPTSLSAEDLRVRGGLTLHPEKLSLTAHYYSDNKELDDFLKEQSNESHALSKKFLRYIPENVLGCLNIKLQADTYSKLGSLSQTGNAVSTLIQFSGIDAEAFLNSLEGDLTFAVSVPDTGNESFSLFCYAETSGDVTRDILREGLRPRGFFGSAIKSVSPDNYSFSMRELGTMHFGVQSEGFYFVAGGQIPFTVPENPLSETHLEGLKDPVIIYFYANLSRLREMDYGVWDNLRGEFPFVDRIKAAELMVRPENRVEMNIYLSPAS